VSEDLLRNEGPKVLAAIQVTLVEGGALNITIAKWADELVMRGILDKLRSAMDDHFRMANAPKIAPANGLEHLPDALRRHLGRG
jgi:hypothetical protein